MIVCAGALHRGRARTRSGVGAQTGREKKSQVGSNIFEDMQRWICKRIFFRKSLPLQFIKVASKKDLPFPGNQSTWPRREKQRLKAVEVLLVLVGLATDGKPGSLRWVNSFDENSMRYMLNLFWQIFLTLLSKVLELLEGAENGRYKVVAKAEPYKNLPVSFKSPSSLYDGT